MNPLLTFIIIMAVYKFHFIGIVAVFACLFIYFYIDYKRWG